MCYHGSAVSHLPPEIIAEVASHLDEKSLIIATHVCHCWRQALLSSPCLWSHINFENEQRALEFMERSKSVHLAAVDLDDSTEIRSWKVRESLKRNINRFTALRAVRVPLLGELLAQPLPGLKNLDIVTLGSWNCIRSLATVNLGYLTNLRFIIDLSYVPTPWLGDILLGFLRGCPLLEVAFFGYGHPEQGVEFMADEKPTGAVSLPRLRSFTHESPTETIHIGLFNQLSLPSTCDRVFTIMADSFTSRDGNNPWESGFPILPDQSGVETVGISCDAQDEKISVLRATFLNSKYSARTSFNIRAAASIRSLSVKETVKFLGFLTSSGMARSVRLLHFEHCPAFPPYYYIPPCLTRPLLELSNLKTLVLWQCNLAIFLRSPPQPEVWCPHVEKLVICPLLSTNPWEPRESDVLEWVRNIAALRKDHGTPLKTVVLYSQEDGNLPHRGLIGRLGNFIEKVEVIGSSVWRGHPTGAGEIT